MAVARRRFKIRWSFQATIKNTFLRMGEYKRCREFKGNSKTIEHVTGARSHHPAQTDYLHQHVQIVNIVRWDRRAVEYKFVKGPCYYEYKPKAVLEASNYELYCDTISIKDKTVRANRPDIAVLKMYR